MHDLAVESQLFYRAMTVHEKGHARGFVNAAGFYSNVAVFDHIDPADSVAAADRVGALDDGCGRKALAVERYGIAGPVLDLDVFGFVGRLFGRDGKPEHVGIGFAPGILEDSPLVAHVNQVAIHRVGFFGGNRDGNLLLVRVGDHVGASLERPIIAPPWGDDPEFRGEPCQGEFEAYLVVALAGGSVRDGIGSLRPRDFSLFFRNYGAGDGGAEEVVSLVNRVRAHHRKHEVAGELLAQVGEHQLACAGGKRFLLETGGFLGLPDVGAIRDHLASEAILEPSKDYGSIEPARVGENHFLDVFSRQ